MLPYPSGDLHIGHWYAMTPSDARARFMRMRGYNVMFPMGFDAFGLPAENAAIKVGVHPRASGPMPTSTACACSCARWARCWIGHREAVSSDPEYYRWTQWFFTQLFKHGLAYKKLSPVDWCPNCNTTLAREQVWGDDRHCERCGTPVIKKNLDQWFFRLTNYAEELLDFSALRLAGTREDAADQLDRPQRRRAGGLPHRSRRSARSVHHAAGHALGSHFHGAGAGASAGGENHHPPNSRRRWTNTCARRCARSDIERESTDKEKTGVFIGAFAVNPVNGVRIPIWIADYVLMTYGTGAIMAVPAHDQRDFDFAMKFGLPILPVIDRTDGLTKSFALGKTMQPGLADALRAEAIPFEEPRRFALHHHPAGKDRPLHRDRPGAPQSRLLERDRRHALAVHLPGRRPRVGQHRFRAGDPGALPGAGTERS